MSKYVLAIPMVLALCVLAWSGDQVLGPCGTPQENDAGAAQAAVPATAAQPAGLVVQPVPLPGQRAINFELPAVVGDEITKVKLSDFNGKWRLLCFYPADFTFV
jgi:peroxiredoxin (alkyl hydroperoxide reductase subunit C)